MPWLFLVIGLVSAIVELHATTFYLSAVAIAAFAAAVAGIWIRPDFLPLVFVGVALALLPAVLTLRRRLSTTRPLPDPDVGQIATIVEIGPDGRRLSVSYRGSRWEAVMESGPPPRPGDAAIIQRKTDKLLHLAMPPAKAR
ncbi:MAG: NfeD family protein [Acetobacteraceae bacterium]